MKTIFYIGLFLLVALILAACGARAEQPADLIIEGGAAPVFPTPTPGAAEVEESLNIGATLDAVEATQTAMVPASTPTLTAALPTDTPTLAPSPTPVPTDTPAPTATSVPPTSTSTPAPDLLPPAGLPQCAVDRNTGERCDYRLRVASAGESGKAVMYFTKSFAEFYITRFVPDDILDSATLYLPDGRQLELASYLGMIKVPAGGTGNAELDATLKIRGVNLEDGELLPQNSYAVLLQNVPAGAFIVFGVRDDASQGVNMGLTIFFGGPQSDGYNVYVDCNTLQVTQPEASPTPTVAP